MKKILKALREEMGVKKLSYLPTGEIRATSNRARNIEIDRALAKKFGHRFVFACYDEEKGPYFVI